MGDISKKTSRMDIFCELSVNIKRHRLNDPFYRYNCFKIKLTLLNFDIVF